MDILSCCMYMQESSRVDNYLKICLSLHFTVLSEIYHKQLENK